MQDQEYQPYHIQIQPQQINPYQQIQILNRENEQLQDQINQNQNILSESQDNISQSFTQSLFALNLPQQFDCLAIQNYIMNPPILKQHQDDNNFITQMVQKQQNQTEETESDVTKLVYLIKNAIEASDKTLGLDVVFLIGKTGSGKSTMVHYLNNIKINDTVEKNPYQQGVHKPILKFQRQIPGVRVDNGKISVTKNINTIKTDNFDIVDSAGLCDTNGYLYDLSNTIGLERSFHNANSIRMLILIQQSSIMDDQRGKKFINLVNQLVGYVKNIAIQQYIPTVTIAITHPVYTSNQTTRQLRLIYQAEQQQKTIQDRQERQRTLIFIDSMIQCSNLEDQKQILFLKQRQISKRKFDISNLQAKILDQNLERLKQKLKESQQEIKTYQLKLQKAKLIEDQNQCIVKIKKIQSDIQQEKKDFDKKRKKYQEKKKQLKSTYQEIEKLKLDLQKCKEDLRKLTIDHREKREKIKLKKPLFNDYSLFNVDKLTNPSEASKVISNIKLCPRIYNPKQVFQISIKNQLKTQTEWIISKIKINLIDHIKTQNLAKAKVNLKEICYISEYIETQNIIKHKEDCIRRLKQFIESIGNNFRKTIDQSMYDNAHLIKENIIILIENFVLIESIDNVFDLLPDFDKQKNSHIGLQNYLTCKVESILINLNKSVQQRKFKSIGEKLRKIERLHVSFGSKIPKITQLFFQFACNFTKLCGIHIQESSNIIKKGNYAFLPDHFTFLSEMNDVAKQFFNLSLEQKYDNLIKFCKQSLTYRVNKGLQNIKSKLTIQNSKVVKNVLTQIHKLLQNKSLTRHLTETFVRQLYESSSVFIENICNEFVDQIKSYIKIYKLQQIKNPLFILKHLRLSNDLLISRTADKYAQLIAKLKDDIANKSIQILQNTLLKIKRRSVEDQDMQSIKSILQKLSKIKWLNEIVNDDQTNSIQMVIQKVSNKLKNNANHIHDTVQKVFYQQLKDSEGIQNVQNQFLSLSTQQNSSIFSNSRTKMRFHRLRSSVKFIKRLGHINNQIKQMVKSTQLKVEQLILKQVENVENSLKNNVENYKLHEIKCDKKFVQLRAICDIQSNSQHKAQQMLNKLYQTVRKYLEDCIQKIKKCELSDHQNLKKYTKSFLKLKKNLTSRPSLQNQLRDNDICLDDCYCQIKQILNAKFLNLVEQIQNLLKNDEYKQCQKKKLIFKNYSNDSIEINEILDYLPSRLSKQCSHNIQSKIDGVPRDLSQLFSQKRFEEMIDKFEEYQNLGNKKKCQQFINNIKNYIKQDQQQLKQLLWNLDNLQDKQIKQLNSKLKSFDQFKQLTRILPDLKIEELSAQLLSFIKDQERKLKQIINQKIEQRNYNLIRNDIIKINRIYQALIKGIKFSKQDIVRQGFQQKLKLCIQQTLNQKLNKTHKQYSQIINQLHNYDTQYQTNYSNQYLKSLKNNLIQSFKIRKNKVVQIQTIQQLEAQSKQFDKVKQQFEQYLSNFAELKDVSNHLEQIHNHLVKQEQIIITDFKYDPQYLNRLKNSHVKSYQQIITELKAQYAQNSTKLQQFLKSQNFEDYSRAMVEIKKFVNLTAHNGIFTKQTPIQQFLNSCHQKVEILTRQYNKKVQNMFSLLTSKTKGKSPTSKINDVKIYFKILKSIKFDRVKDESLLKTIQQTHKKMANHLDSMIPQVNQRSTPAQIAQKIKVVKENQEIINLIKDYCEQISKTQNKDMYFNEAQFSSIIQNKDSLQECIQNFDNFLKELPNQIQKHWKKAEFKLIKQKMISLKNSDPHQTKVIQLFEELGSLLVRLVTSLGEQVENQLDNNNLENVNSKISKINQAEKIFDSIEGLVFNKKVFKNTMKKVEAIIDETIMKPVYDKIRNRQADEVVNSLFELKNWAENIPYVQEKTHEKILNIFVHVNKQKLTNTIVSLLEDKSEDTTIGIQSTYCGEILIKYQKQLSIQRALPPLTISIQQAVKNIKIVPNHDKKSLIISYHKFNQSFQMFKKKYITSSRPDKILSNLQDIKKQVKNSVKKLNQTLKINDQSKTNLAKLIALLFTYVSTKRSAEKFYQAMNSKQNTDSVLFLPHPIQVLSILKFFGCDSEKSVFQCLTFGIAGSSQIPNQFMEIKTGEGKSLILGMTSLIYALLDNKVSCACYSSYLSRRDYESFKDIFIDFNVNENIEYGTLSEIFNNIINKNDVLRNAVGELFMDTRIAPAKKMPKKLKKILILDEVDTFISKQFYGNTYNPCKIIQQQLISTIIRMIWKNRNLSNSQIFNLVKESTQFENLSKKFSDVITKFLKQFSKMIQQVKHYNEKEYVVKDNQIGYKELDGISYNIVDGYKTMFLYMYERQKGNINEEGEKSIMGINILCGKYSYAEMISKFNKIFGVTGTLDCFTQFEDKILQKHKITQKSYAPSVYGNSNRIDKPILIQDVQATHFQAIAKTISDNLTQGTPCLVFFQNQVQIQKFASSHYKEYFKDNINIVTEKNDPSNRDFLIRKSTNYQRLTLFTASFGRGVDFVVCDQKVKQKGVAVIQTYLSEQISEEIQMMGRTARQGSKGTYQLILNLEQLGKKYNITNDEIKKATQSTQSGVRDLLNKKRIMLLKKLNVERQKKIEVVKKIHNQSMEKRSNILDKKINRNDDWFFATQFSNSMARIAILIDATGSMGDVIKAVKGKVMEMIDKLNRLHPNKFQIQIMFYYGSNSYQQQNENPKYWCKTNKLHVSDWTSDIKILKKFLINTQAQGGCNHEAIELALHHLIKENEINGVKKAIFIADAGLEDLQKSKMDYVVHPRNAYRYNSEQIKKPLNLKFSEILKKLKDQKIEVDTYAIGNSQSIVQTCNLISNQAGGKVTSFDPKNHDLAAQIEIVITSQILMKR